MPSAPSNQNEPASGNQHARVRTGEIAIDPATRLVIESNEEPRWGQFLRTWEALANGPLVFVDHMQTPLDNPLVDGEHCIFFDSAGIAEDPRRLAPLLERLAYYLANGDEADAIARRGRQHALTYHRAENRIDSMLRALAL